MSSEERSCLVSRQERTTNSVAHHHKNSSSSDEEWKEESSSYSSNSSYSGSSSDDSYFANWEEHVEKNGTLFYAEYSKNYYISGISSSSSDNAYSVMKKDFKRSSTRRSNKNKQSRFMKFLPTRHDTEQQQQKQQSNSKQNQDSIKVREYLKQHATDTIQEIEVLINPENRFKFGRRATITEAILGISTIPFSDDSNKLILNGHMIHSTIAHEKSIKIGDLIVSVNDNEVTTHNINELLGKFTGPTKVRLKFQKILTQEQILSSNNVMKQITNFDTFVKESNDLLQISQPKKQQQQQLLLQEESKCQNTEEMIFNLMILNEEISDSSGSGESSSSSVLNDVIFCYPAPEFNIIYNIRGTFLTLNSILKSEFKTEPLSTTIKVNEVHYNICYLSFNKVLILYSISENYSTLKETKLRLLELFQYIQFKYSTIDNSDIDDNIKLDLERICKITMIRLKNNYGIIEFETLLQGSKLLPLPKEAQLRIYDALSEMEAMDYRDWNDEPLNSHREFFIYGSALYYRSFLLVNQLPIQQLYGIESFLRCRGIFDFIENQNVRDLVIWVEVPIPSHSRHFLAISSRNQLLLAVILQAFDPERRISDDGIIQERIIPPSLFYIEEIQETLDHLRHGGIETLAKAWITSNKRPQIINENEIIQQNITTIPGCSKKNLIESTLKRNSLSSDDIQLCSSLGGSSAPSLSHSEDSNQKLNDCDDSDSDWDGFPDSHKSSSGFDMSEMTESLLKEVSDIVPTKITAGKENVLLNYVHLDLGTGIILTPPDVIISSLTNKFRKACHVIHTVLQNTKKFRRLLSQESTKPNTHKSLVAIKEHGILITDHENSYWVIGRLFASPPRELYVCHRSDIPQNLVEIAFRLSFTTAG